MFADKYFIAKKIKLARKKAGYTQEKLAEEIGISSKQLSRIEMANYMPSTPTFLSLQKILKMNFEELGILLNEPPDSLRAKILKIIYCSTDKELQTLLELINVVIKNPNLIKK